jgi:hypothetical protein
MKKFLIGAALAGAMVFGGVVEQASAQGGYIWYRDQFDLQLPEYNGPEGEDHATPSYYGRSSTCEGSGSSCLMFGG